MRTLSYLYAMARNGKTQRVVDSGIGQQLALAAAALLAHTQLVTEPLAPYSAERRKHELDVVASALIKAAPTYVLDPGSLTPRQLTEIELQDAAAIQAGAVLLMNDGRTFASVSIKRTDLRQAVAILKTVGIAELNPPRRPAESATEPERRSLDSEQAMEEIEKLLGAPLIQEKVERANRLAISIARSSPLGNVANRAMRLMTVVHEVLSSGSDSDTRIPVAIAHLRGALEAQNTRS